MVEDETEWLLKCLIEECSGKIRSKCRAIYLINPDDDDIRDLDKLIKQFFALKEIWKALLQGKD